MRKRMYDARSKICLMERGMDDDHAELLFITDRSFDITFDKEWP